VTMPRTDGSPNSVKPTARMSVMLFLQEIGGGGGEARGRSG
jgi:hypothetical protein